jgi:Flp pilus assembly protein TadG
MFAALLLPLVIASAMATDFSLYVLSRSKLNLAADAAALHSVRMAAQYVSTGASPAAAATAAGLAGQQWFTAQLNDINITSASSSSISVNMTYQTSPPAFISTVTYSGTFSLLLGSLITSAWPVTSVSTGQLPITPPYIDIIVVLDNSSSMELPSTTAGINQLQALTINGAVGACAYACHFTASKDSTGSFADYYGIARHNNIQLRFDVIISALSTMVSIIRSNYSGGQYRLAIYTFDSSLHTIFALSNNLASAPAALSTIANQRRRRVRYELPGGDDRA